jgi:hypothetical protein
MVCPYPGGERFDAVDDPFEPNRVEEVEGMLAAGGFHIDDRVGRDAPCAFDELTCRFHGDIGVVVAMRDEERRSVRSDVAER